MSVLAEDRVNLVPLIDCMFFLILFFLIVTRFRPDETAIATLLPTGGCTMGAPGTPSSHVTITIVPAGLPADAQPRVLQQAWLAHPQHDRVALRVGGHDPVLIDARGLACGDRAQLDAVHAYLATRLAELDQPHLPRAQQPPITIACFSGVSWSPAIAAIDGVRAYELGQARAHAGDGGDGGERTITFRAPGLRNASRDAIGDELYELMHLR